MVRWIWASRACGGCPLGCSVASSADKWFVVAIAADIDWARNAWIAEVCIGCGITCACAVECSSSLLYRYLCVYSSSCTRSYIFRYQSEYVFSEEVFLDIRDLRG